MTDYLLIPEFFVDFDGKISRSPVPIMSGVAKPYEKVAENNSLKKINLPNQVLMPGFVNCHSHAFQRGLRGLVESDLSHKSGSNFWLWREKMYALANAVDPDAFQALATLAYCEMMEAGFTHVGEFHYLHHDKTGKPFSDQLLMIKALINAANASGINLTLLVTAYGRHSFAERIKDHQKRFFFAQAQEFLAFAKEAKDLLDKSQHNMGLAIHSVRAVDESWFKEINQAQKEWSVPLHIHASEQAAEVRDCLTHTQMSPIALLEKNHLLSPTTTLVHATHLYGRDLDLLAEHNPSICICPSTEKNLGDGVAPLLSMYEQKLNICLGTDQNLVFDPFMEARSLEEQERLRLEKRQVLSGSEVWYSQACRNFLSHNGLRSLTGSQTPTSTHSFDANLIAIELPPEYLWHGEHRALDAIFLASNPHNVSFVMTKGDIVLHGEKDHCAEKTSQINKIRTFFHKNKI